MVLGKHQLQKFWHWETALSSHYVDKAFLFFGLNNNLAPFCWQCHKIHEAKNKYTAARHGYKMITCTFPAKCFTSWIMWFCYLQTVKHQTFLGGGEVLGVRHLGSELSGLLQGKGIERMRVGVCGYFAQVETCSITRATGNTRSASQGK